MWVVVVGSFLLLFFVGSLAGLHMLKWFDKKKQYDAKLKLHRSRMRKVYGCMSCGTELLPDDYRYVCGTCRDEWSYCLKCYEKGIKGDTSAQHKHRMYHERIQWEVAPTAIEDATTSARAFEACFNVYAERSCLGWRRENDGTILDEYRWLSYKEVHARCLALSKGIAAFSFISYRK